MSVSDNTVPLSKLCNELLKNTLEADERTDPNHEVKLLLLYQIALLEELLRWFSRTSSSK
jgi:hypothetical protein